VATGFGAPNATIWERLAPDRPISVAERQAKSGMPVTREGGRVRASAEDLNRWLGRESAGEPVQITTESADLTSELKRGPSVCSDTDGRSQEEVSGFGRANLAHNSFLSPCTNHMTRTKPHESSSAEYPWRTAFQAEPHWALSKAA
jgi:hypothetical protein